MRHLVASTGVDNRPIKGHLPRPQRGAKRPAKPTEDRWVPDGGVCRHVCPAEGSVYTNTETLYSEGMVTCSLGHWDRFQGCRYDGKREGTEDMERDPVLGVSLLLNLSCSLILSCYRKCTKRHTGPLVSLLNLNISLILINTWKQTNKHTDSWVPLLYIINKCLRHLNPFTHACFFPKM